MKLKKHIGRKTLLLLVINAIMGTGIFFLPAVGAGIAGPASVISWVIMGIIAIIMSLCFAEMVSLYPKAGSVYEYSKKAFGEFPSFLVGWIAWIVANITIAMLIVGSILYLLPTASMASSMAMAVLVVIIFNYINYRGIGYSSKLLVFFGIATLLAILAVIIPGSFIFDPERLVPFFVFPHISILLAAYIISETFFGWESACYLAEEVKNARAILPKILVQATAIIAILAIALVLIMLGTSDWFLAGSQPAPLSYLAGIIFNEKFASIFSVFIFIPLIGTAASWIVSSPRLLYAMSRDKILPAFDKIHKKNQTPHKAIFFQTIVTVLVTLVAFGSYITLLSLLIPLVIIMYSVFLFSFMKIRISKPALKRYYRAPFGIVVPAAVIMFNVILLSIWLQTGGAISLFMINIFLILFGIPLYLIIKLQTDEIFVEKFYNKISFTWDYLFPLWYTSNERKKVLRNANINKRSRVLDFGCGTGITTLELSKKAKTVVAVDISEKQISRAFRRIKKAKVLSNVIFIRKHNLAFHKKAFDAVTAVGVLEHIDRPEEEIKRLVSCLKKGGSFSFLSFGKSFTLPAKESLGSRENIKKLFKNLPVTVNIRKEHRKFTDYWYIWGRKEENK